MLAAIEKATAPGHLPFNWFDIALLGLIAFGFWRGRRRGMTKEFLPTIQWVTIMVTAGLGHPYLGQFFQQRGWIRSIFGNHFDEHTAAVMSAYILITVVLLLVFRFIKGKVDPKLEGSNFFGGNEYYWGIPAGVLRYLSMVLVALALLNAPIYSAADIAKIEAYNNRWYGGGLKDYKGDFIPRVDEVQTSVFKLSFTGPYIRDYLGILLIKPATAAKTASH